MIKFEWRNSLSAAESDELADILQRAAEYDAEPEYSRIDFADVERAMADADASAQHLVIWMLPSAMANGRREEAEQIAGLVRLVDQSGTSAEATVVIDPRLRSIGIMTLLLEQVGLDASNPRGLTRTGARSVTAWARGNHPATGRISNRFLIPRTRRVWKLIRDTGSDYIATAATVLEPLSRGTLGDLDWAADLVHTDRLLALRESGRVLGVVSLDLRAADAAQSGGSAIIHRVVTAPRADAEARRRLLDGASAAAHEAGLSEVLIYVDSDDADLVNACRLTGFQHERTDVRYQIGGPQ